MNIKFFFPTLAPRSKAASWMFMLPVLIGSIGLSSLISSCKCGCYNTTILNGYIQDSLSNQVTQHKAGSVYNYETGYEFSSNIDGRILKLGVCLPIADTYDVTLWDAVSKTKLFSHKIKQQQDNTWCYQKVSPFQLSKGKFYVLSVNLCGTKSKDGLYFYLKKKDDSVFYPFISKNFQITDGLYGNPGCIPDYPNQTSKVNNNLLGFVDICFEPYQ
ncbi:MAG: hypothetical protein ACKVT2_00165 [Saprospiraceae bacterium]